MTTYTEQDFDRLSFHDHLFRNIHFRTDFDSGVSDVMLDIDYIADYVDSRGDHPFDYMLAAADLTFHGVTGVKYSLDSQDDKYQICWVGDYFVDVTRRPVVPQLVYLDRPYWRWEFSFALGTQLSFGAHGFTLQLRQELVRYHEPCLPLGMRA